MIKTGSRRYWAILLCLAPLGLGAQTTTVEADTVAAEYHRNRLAAEDRFQSQRLPVGGNVADIGKNERGELYVELNAANGSRLRFYFPATAKEQLKTVSTGQRLTILGTCGGPGPGGQPIEFRQAALALTSSSGATAPATPPAGTSGAGQPRLDNVLPYLVTIEGKNGVGSGFIADFQGQKSIITNIHVLFANSKLKFLDSKNQEISCTAIFFAPDRDIAVIDLEDNTRPGLKILPELSASLVGQPAAVFGNSLGAGVNTSLYGAVVGLGPKVLEVTVPFVHGNSGSPIVWKDSVIGVATYALTPQQDALTANTRFTQVRRFGVRLDNLSRRQLQPYAAEAYKADVREHQLMQHYGEALYRFLCRPWVPGMQVAPDPQLATLREYGEEWNKTVLVAQRGRGDLRSELSNDKKYLNLVTRKLRPLFEDRLRVARQYKFHYDFIGESNTPYLEAYAKLFDLFKRYEEQIANYAARRETLRPPPADSFSGSRKSSMKLNP